jgi:hypothetical protein
MKKSVCDECARVTVCELTEDGRLLCGACNRRRLGVG